jgi:hypothetical protein
MDDVFMKSPSSPHNEVSLSAVQLKIINEEVTERAIQLAWHYRVDLANTQRIHWSAVVKDVLLHILCVLHESTSLDQQTQKYFIKPDLSQISDVMDGLSSDDISEFQNRIKESLETGCWTSLILHRACIFHLRIWSLLITTTAKLRTNIPTTGQAFWKEKWMYVTFSTNLPPDLHLIIFLV